ncbi:hypothetical protein K461DRAFT_133871 [Myriangium duriaei CBS 260.36]|uniref:Uncharacterized protein n=1 Tax=Myriangium duriaei CBS 260.36 TaxID=1168546 RepID=A0A9P4MHA9_9PEZI|nr:hypothetical protein K461DRAFT_133871 [Myriangium duriaei CBS 260.36]
MTSADLRTKMNKHGPPPSRNGKYIQYIHCVPSPRHYYYSLCSPNTTSTRAGNYMKKLRRFRVRGTIAPCACCGPNTGICYHRCTLRPFVNASVSLRVSLFASRGAAGLKLPLP